MVHVKLVVQQVLHIARFFPDDGQPSVLQRNPNPPITLAQRFRAELAAAGIPTEGYTVIDMWEVVR